MSARPSNPWRGETSRAGFDAFYDSLPLDACPYMAGSEDEDDWRNSWLTEADAARRRAGGLPPVDAPDWHTRDTWRPANA